MFVESLLATACVLSLSAASASAASLFVDDDGLDCPAAPFNHVQTAVDVAEFGDTIVLCPGTYVEGPGTPGSNGVTITKSLTIKGAGADQVTIRPKANTPGGGQIAANIPDLRDAVGNIVTVFGAPTFPIMVDISGVTISGGGHETKFAGTDIWDGEFEGGVFSEAGIVFLDAGGSVSATRVTNVVTSERPVAENQPGGYRSNDLGYGIAQVTAANSTPPGATPRTLSITGTRVDRFNKGGILIDSATGDSLPLTATGVVNDATVTASQVIGRNLNSPPNDGTGGSALLTTGTVFGQDGIRVTAGSTLDFTSGLVSQNFMAGAGSDSVAMLPDAAGLRLIGAGPSSVTSSNVLNNSYGVVNLDLAGTAANTAVPAEAANNFWGYPGTIGSTNTGPAVSPAVLPTRPSNPVNGAIDVTFGSDAVHFLPYRAGGMADTDTGYWPIQDAPVPVADSGPSVTLSADPESAGPGQEIELTALASDDFGIKSLTFYDGADVIGSVTPPAESVAYTTPEVCGARELSVLAEDSLGQTASATTAIETVDCPDPPTDDPTIQLSSPPATIGQAGTTVKANVTAEAGVKSVVFFLGARTVCEVTAAPYNCWIVPNGDEIGSQSLRAAVTDKEDRTAQASASTTVSRFKPTGLVLKARRAGFKKSLIRIRGRLRPPARMTTAQAGCARTRVTVTARQGKKTLVDRQLRLASTCGYKLGIRAMKTKKNRGKKVRIKVRFPGNDSLKPISAKKVIR